MSTVKITPPIASHYEEWLELYQSYADFYEFPLAGNTIIKTWEWIMDPNHPVTALLSIIDNKIVGLIHYRPMPNPLRGRDIGFLDDLFVHPSYRRQGIGTKLLKALNAEKQKRNWPLIRWVTKSDNLAAKALYNQLAKKSQWEVYEIF